MAAHKYIDRICLAGALLSLLLSLLFMNGAALGLQAASQAMGYEARLFDTSRVHTIDIVMDDWDSFLETCEDEEYAACAVVIDNEAYKNVGIRAKGNTSLSTVSQLGSDRYSFKIEFDQYDSGKTYYGLDKVCLNNVIQDNTYMKDYLTYRLMGEFGVNAPLCSYVYITVNGEDWGLYLAVEGVEDGFLQRNYGRDHGELYKPDSTGMGGGRGNGMNFDMSGLMGGEGQQPAEEPGLSAGMGRGWATENGQEGGPAPEGMSNGMDSSDTKLQYIDDDPDSYANIFDNAKTDVGEAARLRLIQALKALSEGEDMEAVVDMDQVLRYFVVHNFVVNGDSYTGTIVHNYYLYEQDGRLSMIPWDYNLAFGTFQGNDASGAVNDPIDTPLSATGSGDRPMIDWILGSEEYTQLYHQYFQAFLDSVDCGTLIEEARALIASYVEKDPTKFCTTEEFRAGVEGLRTFCELRMESVSGQLAGAIPSTRAGQSANRDALADASSLNLSDMGTMGMAGGHGGGGGFRGGPADSVEGGENGERPEGEAVPAFGEGMDERRPFGEMGMADGFPGNMQGGTPGESAGGAAASALVLLSVSVLVLLAGLAAAFKFKR